MSARKIRGTFANVIKREPNESGSVNILRTKEDTNQFAVQLLKRHLVIPIENTRYIQYRLVQECYNSSLKL